MMASRPDSVTTLPDVYKHDLSTLRPVQGDLNLIRCDKMGSRADDRTYHQNHSKAVRPHTPPFELGYNAGPILFNVHELQSRLTTAKGQLEHQGRRVCWNQHWVKYPISPPVLATPKNEAASAAINPNPAPAPGPTWKRPPPPVRTRAAPSQWRPEPPLPWPYDGLPLQESPKRSNSGGARIVSSPTAMSKTSLRKRFVGIASVVDKLSKRQTRRTPNSGVPHPYWRLPYRSDRDDLLSDDDSGDLTLWLKHRTHMEDMEVRQYLKEMPQALEQTEPAKSCIGPQASQLKPKQGVPSGSELAPSPKAQVSPKKPVPQGPGSGFSHQQPCLVAKPSRTVSDARARSALPTFTWPIPPQNLDSSTLGATQGQRCESQIVRSSRTISHDQLLAHLDVESDIQVDMGRISVADMSASEIARTWRTANGWGRSDVGSAETPPCPPLVLSRSPQGFFWKPSPADSGLPSPQMIDGPFEYGARILSKSFGIRTRQHADVHVVSSSGLANDWAVRSSERSDLKPGNPGGTGIQVRPKTAKRLRRREPMTQSLESFGLNESARRT